MWFSQIGQLPKPLNILMCWRLLQIAVMTDIRVSNIACRQFSHAEILKAMKAFYLMYAHFLKSDPWYPCQICLRGEMQSEIITSSFTAGKCSCGLFLHFQVHDCKQAFSKHIFSPNLLPVLPPTCLFNQPLLLIYHQAFLPLHLSSEKLHISICKSIPCSPVSSYSNLLMP